jgi:uncharacterized ferritin-like protein (DUF455 family)
LSTVLNAWFAAHPFEKATRIDDEIERLLHRALIGQEGALGGPPAFGPSEIPMDAPGRDGFQIWPLPLHPPKPGLSRKEGLVRLLHDVANIELQAMELAVLTLNQFPDAPIEFREQLAEIARDEARHFSSCAKALADAGHSFGELPLHTSLWSVARGDQTLLDRVMTVHRYLEGSGLDSGESILMRLRGSPNRSLPAREIIQMIVNEEVPHVAFGSRWFREFCRLERRDPDHEFRQRLIELKERAPRPDQPALERRRAAGFTESELSTLLELSRHRPPRRAQMEETESGIGKTQGRSIRSLEGSGPIGGR